MDFGSRLRRDSVINVPACSSVHQHASPLPAKAIPKEPARVPVNHIPKVRLPAKLVHALSDLVAGGIAQPGEEREELYKYAARGGVFKDDRVERRERVGTAVRHQALGDSVLCM